jgi:hypothetical protein
MHALRHFDARVLLDAGESVRALAEYLGHADPGFTLRVYAHLMPASEERTRGAVDQALRTVGLVNGSTGCMHQMCTTRSSETCFRRSARVSC